jgi:hypothetical protein
MRRGGRFQIVGKTRSGAMRAKLGEIKDERG